MVPSEVWLIYRQSERRETASSRQEFQKLAKSWGWLFQERPTQSVNVSNGLGGRAVSRWLLAQRDSYDLYRRLHKARVIVLATHAVRVSIKPGQRPPSTRYLLSLEDFARYKGFFLLCQNFDLAGDFYDLAEKGLSKIETADLDDPRSLPLHLMSREVPTDLGTAAGRGKFNSRFGSPGARRTEDGWSWERNRHAQHGREELLIGRTRLERGAHWDVSQNQGRGKKEFPAITKIWSVQPNGYVNVYPDGYVRGGKHSRLKV